MYNLSQICFSPFIKAVLDYTIKKRETNQCDVTGIEESFTAQLPPCDKLAIKRSKTYTFRLLSARTIYAFLAHMFEHMHYCRKCAQKA